MSERRPRRRRAPADLPPSPEDWTVAEDGDPHLTRVEGPTAITGELGRLTRRAGWAERLGAARVAAAWADIVGEELTAHCEPVRLAGRVLTVRAASPVWATQLRYLTTQLVERADAVLGPGSVREVSITVGRLEGRPEVRGTGRDGTGRDGTGRDGTGRDGTGHTGRRQEDGP